jgi:RNA polymerase sigma-70 factor, ECF subfamily
VQNDDALSSDFMVQLTQLLPQLRRYASTFCRNTADREDLVQSACVKAIAARQLWDPETNLKAWVCKILRNHFIDTYRRRKLTGIHTDLDTSYDVPSLSASSELQVFVQQVQKAMLLLPKDMQEVMHLVCIEEFSYKDASEILNVPIGTIMSRLARARLKLLELTGQSEMDLR